MNDWQKILVYSQKSASQAKVRQAYEHYRKNMKIPVRCDRKKCEFYRKPLVWNGRPFKPILNHKSGNRKDNNPYNLELLCPICDSQEIRTRGGANKGRIRNEDEHGYERLERDGSGMIVVDPWPEFSPFGDK